MHRLILQLSAALLTFAIGIAVSAIYSMSGVMSIGEPTLPVEVPVPQVEMSCYPGISIPTPSTAKDSYFPSLKLSPNEYGDQFVNNWYSAELRAMNEAPLYSPDNRGLESYRFLWLRSFHHPIAVRIWRCGTEGCITVKELNGSSGFESGTLIFNATRKLSATEWNEFIRRLEYSCYWNLPSQDGEAGFDGARWIFEAVKGGRYHIVDRWTPQSGSYRELCLYALTLSGLKVDSDDVY